MDIRRADLPLLVSLDALLDELNVTRASRRLHLSQSTVSGHLARLRDLFGDPLLVPAEHGRGMVATERALQLRGRLRDLLAELQSVVAESRPFDAAASKRTFVVAINDNAFNIIGLPVAADLLGMHAPGLRLSYVAPDPMTLAARMERGEIDLHVGATRTLPDHLRQRPLLSDRFRMAQRKGHPRGTDPLTLDAYCAQDHVLVSPKGDFHGIIDDTLSALNRQRRVALAVPGYNQVGLLLQASDAVATLPGRMLERFDDALDIFDLPFDLDEFTLSMAWHPRSHNDPAHRWLRERFLDAGDDSP